MLYCASCTPSLVLPEKNGPAKGHQKNHADKCVSGKECLVHPAQIVSPYYRMLIDKQNADNNYTGQRKPAEACCRIEQYQNEERLQVEQTRNPQRVLNTKFGWNREQSSLAVIFLVLTSIKHVEPGCPHKNCERQ